VERPALVSGSVDILIADGARRHPRFQNRGSGTERLHVTLARFAPPPARRLVPPDRFRTADRPDLRPLAGSVQICLFSWKAEAGGCGEDVCFIVIEYLQ